MKQAKGTTSGLPSITQYLSMVLDHDEQVALFQSDMSSAFYLFAIPECWPPYLCFNLQVDGSQIGRESGLTFYLACSVILMGWKSAVRIMQEIADRLTIGRLAEAHKVRRDAPVPPWMVDVLKHSGSTDNLWFHVYLDNFCSMGKCRDRSRKIEAENFHLRFEDTWSSSGVVSSSSKRVVGADRAVELGAELNGIEGTL